MLQIGSGRRRLLLIAGLMVGVTALVAALLASPGPASAASFGWAVATASPPSSSTVLRPTPLSVACPGTASCVAVGTITAGAGNRGLLLSDNSGTWSSVQAPYPANGAASPAVSPDAVACPSTTSCVAVGTYVDTIDDQDVLLLTDSSGTWSDAEAPYPSGAATSYQQAQVSGVSCPSTTSCVAVGIYQDSNDYTQGYLLTDSSGTWTAAKAPLPSGATQAYGAVNLTHVTCFSSGHCVALGTYLDASGNTQGLVLSDSSGTWTAAKAPLPSGAASNPEVTLGAVSCAATTSCVIVGSYHDTSGNTDGVIDTDSSGTLSGAEASLPAGATTTDQVVDLASVSCPSTTSCVAVGSYLITSGLAEGVVLTDASGTWTTAEAQLPSGAHGLNVYGAIDAVVCLSSASCTAVGSYLDSSYYGQGVVLTDTSGVWSAAELSMPSGAGSNPDAALVALACSGASCAAVGNYEDTTSTWQGLLATGSAGSWTSSEVVVPSGTSPSPDVTPSALTCVSATTCIGVGQYVDASNYQQGLAFTDSSGSWALSELPVPSSAYPGNPYLEPSGISCVSSSSCVAIGTFRDLYFYQQALLLTDSSGTWTAAEAPLPAGAASDPTVSLTALSCASATSCVAVGSYEDSSNDYQGVLLTDSSGTWTAAKVSPPAGAASNPSVAVTSVSCFSSTSCIAVGTYNDTSGNTDGLLLTDSSGTWTAAKAPLPSGATTSDQFVSVAKVACTSATACVAVGSYFDTSYHEQGLVLTDSSGTWSAAKAALPSGAGSDPYVSFNALSCASSSSCVAVAYYEDTSYNTQGLLLTDSSGTWSAAKAPLPSGAVSTGQAVELESVSCGAAGVCAAVGTYLGTSNYEQGVLLTDSSGTWTATAAPLPSGSQTNPGAAPASVSCLSSGSCVTVGSYTDANGGRDGLLETYTPAGLLLAPATVSWSVTLNGYDASSQSAATIDVDSFGNGGWDLTALASAVLTSGSHQLGTPSVNGSAASASSSSAPAESCVGSCTLASGDAVTYPLTIPTSSAADLYNSLAGNGIGEVALATHWWVALPASSYASGTAYSDTVTLTLSSGP